MLCKSPCSCRSLSFSSRSPRATNFGLPLCLLRRAISLISYDVGLDELRGCTPGLIELPPTDRPFDPDTKVLVEHKEGKELCIPEAALKGHMKHGDEVLDWSGCTGEEEE